MNRTPPSIVRDLYDGHKAEHCARLDTPTHFGTVEFCKAKKNGNTITVPRYSIMLRSRSELVVSAAERNAATLSIVGGA